MIRVFRDICLVCFVLFAGALLASRSEAQTAFDTLVSKYAAQYGLPETLIHSVIKRESNYNPGARHAGNYGLMQIKPQTARTMGYRGPAEGLLNADTNLMFGVKYLAGAYLVAGGNEKKALRLYSRGYYYEAKRKGLLEETGLKPAR